MDSARLLATVLAALLLASCTATIERSGEDLRPRQVGAGLEDLELEDDRPRRDAPAVPDAPTVDDEPPSSTWFELVVVGPEGRPAPLVPVTVLGPQRFTRESAADGRLRVDGPPGDYTYEIAAGCHRGVLVHRGAGGRFGIAEGHTADARIEVEWLRRHGPQEPAFASLGPYWPIGRTVTIRYDLVDRCPGGDRLIFQTLDRYRFEPAPNLEIVGDGTVRSDENGYGWVDVRCTAEGATSLVVADLDNPRDTLDLVEADRSSGHRPSCRAV